MILRDDVSERAEARVGQVLKAKWRLDSVLGIGGMATVYAATHRNRSRVAIKMLHPEVAVSQDVTTRFLREGYVGNAVAHPGTVRVLDDDQTEDGAPFLVMELLEGESFGARLDRDGPFPPHEVALLGYQLLDVLAAAHAAHIVHRDLKPDNVFLTHEGRVKVLDFGIARLRAAAHESSAATQAGSLLGTPAFMAPEQALGRWKEVDERTDIWAIGATLFTLLTGHFVHEAEAVQEQLVLAATSKAPAVATFAPQTPLWLAAIVDKALSFAREARYADARSMQAALRESGSGLEFPSYPLSAPGASQQYASGQYASGVFTPNSAPTRPGLLATPAAPRAVSSPSFGEGATIVASEPTPPLHQSGGTFASVQAVARSAQEPAPKRRSKLLQLGLVALGFSLVSGGSALLWFTHTPDAPSHSLTLPTAAAAPPLPTTPHREPAAPPKTSATATPPAASPPPSAHAHLATNSNPPPLSAKKTPPSLKPHAPPPPEQKENLFDNRH